MTADSVDRTIDVREIDGEPFDDIMSALGSLEDDERLELIAPFEPKPLYEVLDDRGYDHEARQQEGDLWQVLIEHA
ncbi:DUF2249 domain-containing protein [Halobiforma nitratireducens]|uniref:DUF2249 domain-containing protein n=1 Tax=Halobiforma nitratireducens JCM 10879 TaxID=1227454 RepID=M0LZ52_9EURY|nr:DUF2249 domain-containing protein [Halobiforma nitratireducens]EMA38726.1 hypothetical protein C446_09398 [Halobiforma nitratireducens JCM 10879]